MEPHRSEAVGAGVPRLTEAWPASGQPCGRGVHERLVQGRWGAKRGHGSEFTGVQATGEHPAPLPLARPWRERVAGRPGGELTCSLCRSAALPLCRSAALREPRAVVDDEARFPRGIRVAAATRDAVQLSRLLNEPRIERHLQELGEAVVSLLEHDRAAAAGLAHALAASLTARAWPGDGALAELLLELTEDRQSEHRRIRADLDGMADLLEGPADMGFGGVLDCRTGDTWPAAVIGDWAGEGDPPDPDAAPEAQSGGWSARNVPPPQCQGLGCQITVMTRVPFEGATSRRSATLGAACRAVSVGTVGH